MIIFNFNPKAPSINSANNGTFIFFFYTLFLVIFNVMLFFICICLFLLFIICIGKNPLPMLLPKPLPIPEEIFIPEGTGIGTGLILVGVLLGLFEILRKIERNNRPPMVLQLEAITVRVDDNFIYYGVIDLNDLTGHNLRLLYSANDDVLGAFVLREGVIAYAILTDSYVTMDTYNALRDQVIDFSSTHMAYRVLCPSPVRSH